MNIEAASSAQPGSGQVSQWLLVATSSSSQVVAPAAVVHTHNRASSSLGWDPLFVPLQGLVLVWFEGHLSAETQRWLQEA